MLDIKFIRENTKLVKKAAKDKGFHIDIDKLLKLDDQRREFIAKVETLKAEQNKISKGLKGKPSKAQIEKSKKIKKELESLIPRLDQIEEQFGRLILLVPNIYSADTPIGKDERDNKEIKKIGTLPKFNFSVKDHVELGMKNNLLDIERGVKIGGPRSYILKNELVILEQALLRFALDKVKEKGFEVMNVPVIVKEETLVGSGFFPFGREDIYEVNERDRFLVGTSEASLVYYYANEILNESDLPKLLSGITTCFRKEAGTYGKDTKGVIRVHQFNKVEQVVLCTEKDAKKMFDFILDVSKEIVKALKLPYRLVQMCTGELGAKNHKQVDIEVWFPGQNKYRETHSCSYLIDYQGRRANIKYKDKKGMKHFVHTLNNTAIATPRILGAILENYQQKDGSIKIPEVLQKYTGFKVIKR